MRAGRAAVLLVAAGALVMSNVGTATAAGPSARQSVRLSVDRTTCLATLAMSWGNTTTSNVAFVVEDVSTPQGLVHVLSGVPFSGKATATFQGVATSDGTKQDVQGLLQKGGYPAVTDVKTVACHGPWTYRDDWTVR